MPMPKPESGESQDDFIQRCMGNEVMRQDYPDSEQRSAVCHTQWKEKEMPMEEKAKFKGFEIKALASKDAEIWLYDEIGGGGWFSEGISAKKFADDLNALGKLSTITLRINSPGGDVFDGIAIYNILKQHPARVIVNIDGLAASIASVIAMAGDEIRMADNALMMIHEAWTVGMGNAGDFRETADRLDKVNGSILGAYAKKTGKDQKELAAMMAAETWMTAQESLDHGFVHSIGEPLQMAAHFDMGKFKFKNPPVDKVPMQPASAVSDREVPMQPPDPNESPIAYWNRILNKE